MLRVTKPGGLVAIRDADYQGMLWYPTLPELDRWREIYRAVARRNGAEPDGGRHLIQWALDAGIERDSMTASTGAWLYCTDEERAWWAEQWAVRTVDSAFGEQAREYELSTIEEQPSIADGWRAWAAHPAGTFMVPCGELLLRVPSEIG